MIDSAPDDALPYHERICPFMSRPLSAIELGNNLLPPEMFWASCQGPRCMCFRCLPTKRYCPNTGQMVDDPYGGPEHGWCILAHPNRS